VSRGILIAGIGNVFLGDDGFGVEVVRRLTAGPALPASTRVADFGIRGLHLAYELLDGYDALILIDAMPRGEPPGTLYVLEPDSADDADLAAGPADPHSMAPAKVLSLLRLLGGSVDRTLVVGCEPLDLAEHIGLSDPVASAIDEAVALVHRLATTEAQR
jgi:hydrogenase maturation protease